MQKKPLWCVRCGNLCRPAGYVEKADKGRCLCPDEPNNTHAQTFMEYLKSLKLPNHAKEKLAGIVDEYGYRLYRLGKSDMTNGISSIREREEL